MSQPSHSDSCGGSGGHDGGYDAGATAAISAGVDIGVDTSLLDCSHASTGVDLSVCLDADINVHLGDGHICV